MVKLKVIVNCGPCEQYIAQCLDSLQTQSYTNWQAYVTVDACKDHTYSNAARARGGDRRVQIFRNRERAFSLCNLVRAIERSHAAPEDVIVNLDGDDWLARPDALEIIASTYATHNSWLTYGSWISNVAGLDGVVRGLWPAYPEHTTNFRRIRWLGTAVRTWKKWLWDLIDDRDLRDPGGDYYRVSEDQVVMLPLLEMSGTAHARHIPEALMIYNQLNSQGADPAVAEERHRNAIYIEQQRPYSPLQRPITTSEVNWKCRI